MNWIIKNTKKLRSHTQLINLLTNDWIDIDNYNWFLSDLDVVNYADYEGNVLPINFMDNYHLPTNENFKIIVDSGLQVIWGVISAVNKQEKPNFNDAQIPFVEGNDMIWNSNYFQVSNSVVEITAWDSSYTIVKFKDEKLSNRFQLYFTEAIPLEKYKF